MSDIKTKLDTKMQGIDTIISLSQYYINYNLKQLFNSKIKRKDDRTGQEKEISLKELELYNEEEDTWLRGKLKSASIEIYVPNAPTRVIFILEMQDGTMEYNQRRERMTINIEGWKIGFEVDMNLEKLDESDVPQEVKDSAKNLGSGAYTIKQLFMDFQNAGMASWSEKYTQIPSNASSTAKQKLGEFINVYLDQIKKEKAHILGYSIEVNNPGRSEDVVATFAPQKLNFRTNQYRANGLSESESLRSSLDTLNFHIMTDKKRNFPSNLLEWSGNWVEPGDSRESSYGTMAIAKSLFVDKFLLINVLPRLINLNIKLENRQNSIEPKISKQPFIKLFDTTADGGTYSYSSNSISEAWPPLAARECKYELTHKATVKVVSGSNYIKVDVKTCFSCEFTHWHGIKNNPLTAKTWWKAYYEVPLNLEIHLKGIMDGSMTVHVIDKTPPRHPGMVVPYDEEYLVKFEGEVGIFIDIYKASGAVFNDVAHLMIEADFAKKEIKKHLQDALNVNSCFVFPGGKQFFMKTPRFNNNCDLIVTIEYKK